MYLPYLLILKLLIVSTYVHVQAIDQYSEEPDFIYGLFMHEIIHALEFSSRLFDK